MKSLNLRANGRLEQEMPRNMRFQFLDNSTNSEQGINLMSGEISEGISESSEAKQGMGAGHPAVETVNTRPIGHWQC